jgi:hypothetical protein
MMTQTALLSLLLLSATKGPEAATDREEENFGAVQAPAVLPAAAMATYFYLGLSELGAGYRYGLGLLEIEARVRGDWRFLSLGAEGLLKISALEQNGWELAPYLGVGLAGDAGATYLSPANFSYFAIRVLGGMNTTYRVADTVYLLLDLEMTLDLSVSPANAARFTALAGVGAEFYLNPQISVSVLGLVGPDVFHPRPGETSTQVGYGIRLGMGFRLL